MDPAMDRGSKMSVRWFWATTVLTLCVCDLGCARLKALGKNDGPLMVGQVLPTGDIYANGHRPLVPAPVENPQPDMVVGDEVAGTILPDDTSEEVRSAGVALQPPRRSDSRDDVRVAPATVGVPNAARILAAGERRARPGISDDPGQLVAEARTAVDAMASYQVAMHRQEQVNGALLPEEDVILAVRRDPGAVRLTWPNGPNQGREVLYRADEPGGQMHVRMANPALPRLSLVPDNPMVMRNSRHPVTEAGFDPLIRSLEASLQDPSAGSLVAFGPVTPIGFDRPHMGLNRTTPAGEVWKVYLDPQTHLPALVEATDAQGNLLERYTFRDVRHDLPELALSDAFDPNARWGAPVGLLGRLTRSHRPDTGADSPTPP